jgi:hypothetical protein
MTITVSATPVEFQTWATIASANTSAVEVTVAPSPPVSYEGDALVLDPKLMTLGKRYPVQIGNEKWWAIKRDEDLIDFRKRR